jgi:hypothetical protein
MKIRVSNKWHEVKLIVTSNGKTFGGEQLDKIQAFSEARGIMAQENLVEVYKSVVMDCLQGKVEQLEACISDLCKRSDRQREIGNILCDEILAMTDTQVKVSNSGEIIMHHRHSMRLDAIEDRIAKLEKRLDDEQTRQDETAKGV